MENKRHKSYRYGLIIVLIALIVIDVLMHRHHPYFAWDNLPAFNAMVGIGGAMALIYLARVLGSIFIQQKEDYYDCKCECDDEESKRR